MIIKNNDITLDDHKWIQQSNKQSCWNMDNLPQIRKSWKSTNCQKFRKFSSASVGSMTDDKEEDNNLS